MTIDGILALIAPAIMVGYFIIKGVKEVLEHADWYQGRIKKKAEERKEKEYQEYKDIIDETVGKKLNIVSEAINDLLRNAMKQIYYEYAPYKKIPEKDKLDFDHMFKNYTGNTFIENIQEQMKDWEVVQNKSDIK